MSKSVYELVTDKMIEQLEKGIIPWEKPWTGIRSGAFNRVSKKSYSLLNQMLLKYDGEYATFKQWSDLGGRIRKGEKADQILNTYWTREDIKVEHVTGNKAYYSPSCDLIRLPLFEQFTNANEYYSTAFHESVHSTMKESRCNCAENRKGKLAAFGSDEYSREELVAEIGSASLMNIIGIETAKSLRNSAAYVQNWLSVLRNDVKFIVSAGSKAAKAVDYILGEA